MNLSKHAYHFKWTSVHNSLVLARSFSRGMLPPYFTWVHRVNSLSELRIHCTTRIPRTKLAIKGSAHGSLNSYEQDSSCDCCTFRTAWLQKPYLRIDMWTSLGIKLCSWVVICCAALWYSTVASNDVPPLYTIIESLKNFKTLFLGLFVAALASSTYSVHSK